MPSNSILNIKKDGKWVEIPALKGEDGHTPVKGTDYWTSDDKAEIVNEVLELLPRAESEVY